MTQTILTTRPTSTTTKTTPPLPTWPTPSYTSTGNYLTDATILEPHIPGPLYATQQSLPRLPIPSISTTIQSFLPTALPLCQNQNEFTTLQSQSQSFAEQASHLQSRLESRAKGEFKESSWLQQWWNEGGYLCVRDPVVINVSYFFHFQNDTTVFSDCDNDNDDDDDDEAQIRRAVTMLLGSLRFRELVCSGSLQPEQVGKKDRKTTLCSVMYKYMFHACRIPQLQEDVYKMYDPSRNRHVVVACRGRFYAFDFLDDKGGLVGREVLEERLREVKRRAATEEGGDVGWLTGWGRDEWAVARGEMVKLGGERMERALEVLESGVLMICLDDEAPASRNECGKLFWHGNITSSHNRWFDKSIQLICTKNGKAGLVGEHSMMDGMPVVNFVHHMTQLNYRDAKALFSSGGEEVGRGSEVGSVKDIFEDCRDVLGHASIIDLVGKAKNHLTAQINAHSLSSLAFHGYGSTTIKKSGFSPDAYIQLAMLLATYRLFSTPAATYEATQVRPFLHGRTETTRPVNEMAVAFVRKMGFRPKGDEGDEETRGEKMGLLREAAARHVKYVRNAAGGMGVDRHFLGLRMCVQDGEAVPELFENEVFQRSKHWRVSTSHLSHPAFANWGYGEVVPDGVGLSYMIKEHHVVFNVTALKKEEREGDGWAERLTFLLEEALLEMKGLVDADENGGGVPRSKM